MKKAQQPSIGDPGEKRRVEAAIRKGRRSMGDPAKWLLQFAMHRDLTKQSEAEREKLNNEILALSTREPWWDFSPDLNLQMTESFLSPWLHASGPGTLLFEFQKTLRERFNQAKQGRWWEHTYPPQTKRIRIFNVRAPDGSIYSSMTSESQESPLDYLLRVATNLVEAERERFGICQNHRCGKMFVSERKNRGKYCSPTCSSYVRVMKSRGKL